jgi:hypothetical protein
VTYLKCPQIRGENLYRSSPGIGGFSGIGKVVTVSTNAKNIKQDDFVFFNSHRSWAERVNVSESNIFLLENGISLTAAASLPYFISAWAIISKFHNLKAGGLVVQSNGDTAVGFAITQLCKANGINILSPTDAEISDPSFLMKYKGKVSHCILGSSGKIAMTFMRILASEAKVVVYRGRYVPTVETLGLDISYSAAIFKNISVSGFDYEIWSNNNVNVQKAISSTTSLLREEKVKLSPELISSPIINYQKAIANAGTKGAFIVLKI